MNALLLAGACIGALTVFLTADPDKVAAAKAEAAQQVGWMERNISVDPTTGAVEETSIIAFRD